MADALDTLKHTPLDSLHRSLGGKMVPFAGYAMPLHYGAGILQEHLHTRSKAGLFDVSHMGQVGLRGAQAAAALEKLVTGDMLGLAPGRMRYTLLTNAHGGIIDDLMVANTGEALVLVVNAARKFADLAHLNTHLDDGVTADYQQDWALLALQGPSAAAVLGRFVPAAPAMRFMEVREVELRGIPLLLSRSGYTGEDGFELSVSADHVETLAQILLDEEDVLPVGLGARDSLRLEAGLCLYGQDIDETTSPVEADLAWAIGKRRRAEGGFIGAEVVLDHLRNGVSRKRVGIQPSGRVPARQHTEITDHAGGWIGTVTSGAFGPSANRPVAMGYVDLAQSEVGTPVNLIVRGRVHGGQIVGLPFVPHRYAR